MRKKRRNPTALDVLRSIRREWTIDPRTRVVPSKKLYFRARAKRETLRTVRKEDNE